MRRYTIRVAIAFDQLVNTVLGGYPNETLSTRAWRLGDLGGDGKWVLARKIIDALFINDPDHCEQTYLYCRDSCKACEYYLSTQCVKCSKYPEEN